MVQVVAHDRGGLVEQLRGLGLTFAFQRLRQELRVVSAAGLDEDLLDGSALSPMSAAAACPSKEQAYFVHLLLVRHRVRAQAWRWDVNTAFEKVCKRERGPEGDCSQDLYSFQGAVDVKGGRWFGAAAAVGCDSPLSH